MNRLERDPRLGARVLRRFTLVYAEGGSVDEDRPAFVRAASSMAWLGDELAVVQDDASFIALGKPGEAFRSISLPRGPGGRRRFEVALGNKYDKLDLEACVACGDRLLAFGSGSLPVREQIATLSDGHVSMIDAASFYAKLRDADDFSGGQLNVEGVAIVGNVLRLFQRSNGRQGGHPASVDVALDAFMAWLAGGRWAPLHDERGATAMKAEGIAIHREHADRAWLVLDPDDADRPAELCEVALEGPWR